MGSLKRSKNSFDIDFTATGAVDMPLGAYNAKMMFCHTATIVQFFKITECHSGTLVLALLGYLHVSGGLGIWQLC